MLTPSLENYGSRILDNNVQLMEEKVTKFFFLLCVIDGITHGPTGPRPRRKPESCLHGLSPRPTTLLNGRPKGKSRLKRMHLLSELQQLHALKKKVFNERVTTVIRNLSHLYGAI